ncbi:MAG: hypothetical protein JXN61_06880 [Sedimentisphaerales bacterium]|nr:hypothetical protein [Sedimentisphaerales bacterium]
MDESNTTRSASVTRRCEVASTSYVNLNSRFTGRRRAVFRRPNRGMAMIWVAIFLLLIVLIVGLGLDSAKAFLVAHQLQNAADAAALAGACLIKINPVEARRTAIEIAYENFADRNAVELVDNPDNLADGDVVIGWYSRMLRKFVAAPSPRNAVKVVVRRTDTSPGGPVPLNFGAISDVCDVSITRYAIAMTHGGTGAGVIALSPGEPAKNPTPGLLIHGGAILDVNDGMIQVNSEADNAVVFDGSSMELSAEELNLCGDLVAPAFDLDALDFPIDDDAPPLPDPLCPDPPGDCLPPPSWDSSTDLSGGDTLKISGGTHVFEPGYYSGGFDITGGDIALKPGIYILGGGPAGKGGLVIGGNAHFCAQGVMFYITENGKVDLAGGGPRDCYIRVTPPDPEITDFCGADFAYPPGFDFATYSGISIFQDRANDNPVKIRGTSLLDLDGALYFPQAHVDLGGTGDGFGNQLIAWTIEVAGDADIVINYRGDDPEPSHKSFLVE